MLAILKRKPKTPAGEKGRKVEREKIPSAPLLPLPPAPAAPANGHATNWPAAFTQGPPQLLRARHVMAATGLNRDELKKFIECKLLTPLYRPDSHRIGRRNDPRHQRAFFAAVEVQALVSKLKPRPS